MHHGPTKTTTMTKSSNNVVNKDMTDTSHKSANDAEPQGDRWDLTPDCPHHNHLARKDVAALQTVRKRATIDKKVRVTMTATQNLVLLQQNAPVVTANTDTMIFSNGDTLLTYEISAPRPDPEPPPSTLLY